MLKVERVREKDAPPAACFFKKSTKFYGEKERLTEIRMQGSKLYEGNLGHSVTNDELEDLATIC